MSITVLLVLIIVLAFLIGGVVERRLPRLVSRSGIEYAGLGVLLGPELGFAVLGKQELSTLDPFLQMVFGLVGFILGLRTRARFSNRRVAVAGMFAGLGCFLGLAGVIGLLLMNSAFFDISGASGEVLFQKPIGTLFGYVFELTLDTRHLQLSLGIAAAVGVSSLGVGKSLSGEEGPVTRFLKASASASQVVGIIALGLLLAASRANGGANHLSLTVLEWAFASIAFGICVGALFGLFIGRERDPMHTFLATVGLVAFAAGIGAALSVSPMFINLLAGVTVALTSPQAENLSLQLRRLERPLRIIVMVFVGALWITPAVEVWLFALLVVFVRWRMLRFFTYLSNQWILGGAISVRKLGDGMLSQGAVAAAMGASFAQHQSAYERALILTTVLVVALSSDLISRGRWRALLYSAGESGQLTSSGTSEL